MYILYMCLFCSVDHHPLAGSLARHPCANYSVWLLGGLAAPLGGLPFLLLRRFGLLRGDALEPSA